MFWFDTPLYHTLYQHRNDTEAKIFIANLLQHLQPKAHSRLVDVACGKGRHVKMLGALCPDSNVLGLDLAEHSIQYAQEHNNLNNCNYAVHDMRHNLAQKFGHFDIIFNLFTSFGYFQDKATHAQVIGNWSEALLGKGVLLIDYMNVVQVIENLVPQDSKEIDGYTFLSKRRVENGYIIKDIYPSGKDLPKDLHYQERVATFTLEDFTELLAGANLRITETFGNYQLAPFDAQTSPRLILLAEQKKK